ncbi:hypothetical protein HUG17_0198 [Dermatophagoides farinae]|uniref:Uncharacterized protein n=1 Tax=Dermatophagoides farinae TaxID=6954 RepID=A0A9D4P829_DERFA|nr:hypothetical protein HUG17_0198 [Dermatophagoides farinae]
MNMETYLQKLLINQQNENILREERDQMLKRHEHELEEIDERMAELIRQRNMIIEEIQNFTKNTTTNTLDITTKNIDNNNNDDDGDVNDKNSVTDKQFITSTNSAFKPITESPCLDSNNNPIDSGDVSSPTTTSSSTKPCRTLKLTPRVRTSASTSNMVLTRIPESPTTVQIESMLSKVRNNVAIDPNTLNKCIDLLSTPKSSQKTMKKVKKNNNPIISTAAESSPKQPSSPKRRFETPEERRRRIERVLFEIPSNKMHKGAMSKSFSSLNTMDLLSINHNQLQHGKQQPQRTSNLSLNRYSNRSKVRRNHSLSPLRFGAKKSKTNNGDEQSEPTSPTIMTAENSPKEIRKYKSEQQLFFDENISMASFEEDSTTTSQNNDLSSEIDPDKYFFPVDIREKPLMSKEELNKIKNKKTMVKSKSIGWAEQAANSMNDQSLRVDYLSHIRRSSASPEQKQREKELNNLNNTKKFRCYQDFWENKTKEIMDKKDRFEMKQSQQSQQPQQQQQQQQHQLTNANKTKTNCSSTAQHKVNNMATKIPELIGTKKSTTAITKNNENVKSIKQSTAMVNIMNDGNKENRTTYRPQFIRIIETKKHPTTITTTNNNTTKNPIKIDPLKLDNTSKQQKLLVPDNPIGDIQKSPSPSNYSDSDSEKLIEKLRYFKQDIRRQKMKQQMKQQQQQQQQQKVAVVDTGSRIPAKSLDLQYMNKHNLNKQQSLHPNQQQQQSLDHTPLSGVNNNRNNRIKLVRSYSREDSTMEQDLKTPTSPQTPNSRQTKMNIWRQHHSTSNSLSLDHHHQQQQQLTTGMRSTYF